MKIVVLSDDFKPHAGGVAELAFQVCKELAARGHQVDVLTHRHEGCPDEEAARGVGVHRVFDRRPPISIYSLKGAFLIPVWTLRTRYAIRRRVRKIQPDVILCTDKRTFWLPVVRRAACRYALFMHGEDVASCIKDRNPLSRAILKKLLSGAVWTFFNSTYSLSLAKGAGLVERASAVGCGFLPEDIVEEDRRAEARQRLGWSDGPVLLTVSRLVLRKGIDTVMRAMGIVLRVFPNCRYAVVGAGPDRAELESLARELGLVDKVDFMGRVSEETKRLVYLASDLYVMPSRPGSRGEVEGFGISFLEANAHGLAVVGSRAGGIPDAVEDGANGVLVPPSDPAALGEAIVMLLADPPRRRGMALVGQKRIRERFNWKSIVDKIEEKLCSAAGGR